MLVATRDPMHHSGAPDPSSHRHERTPFSDARPQTPRLVGLLQLAGSFLAIPVALGSAYSVYQANFSPDTQCQQLRASIIAMIDKKIDAATRRMLVRRDVQTFAKSCGAFDPDAKAAFLALLATEPRTVPARPVAASKSAPPKAETVKVETKTDSVKAEAPKSAKVEPTKAASPRAETAARSEQHPSANAKRIVPSAAERTDAVARDHANADARWLDAVRGALVSHERARAAAVSASPKAAAAEPPALRATFAPAAAAPVAPRLPRATAIATPAEPSPARSVQADDHPVPPAAIPDGSPLDIAKAASDKNRSTWISNIPLVGQLLDK
jgi:hypothetical protein